MILPSDAAVDKSRQFFKGIIRQDVCEFYLTEKTFRKAGPVLAGTMVPKGLLCGSSSALRFFSVRKLGQDDGGKHQDTADPLPCRQGFMENQVSEEHSENGFQAHN